MKLHSVQITNYRSIFNTEEIVLSNYNVIVGRNNQGKTNILNALDLAFECLSRVGSKTAINTLNSIPCGHLYSYERDYPILLQDSFKDTTPTIIILRFKLNKDLINKFYKDLKIHNNGEIKLKISIGKDERANIAVIGKPGSGSTSYNNNIKRIISFILEHFVFVYIPSIRTEKESINIIEKLVGIELDALEQEKEYKEALETITKFEQEKMNKIADSIIEPIKLFLPEIKNAEILVKENRSRYRKRYFQFSIDDGNLTEINLKGDGVKSVVTLALLQSLTPTNISKLFAIEEPESHLHPEAIHALNKVLSQISDNSSLIITTHNPIFINLNNIENNFIIKNNSLVKASSLSKIRELLGTMISDSLYITQNVLIVEGSNDAKALKHILSIKNNKIKQMFENNLLSIHNLSGVGNLKTILKVYTSLLINVVVAIDNDDAAKNQFKMAINEGLLKNDNIVVFNDGNSGQSEFEDLLEINFYIDLINKGEKYQEFKDCAKHQLKKITWTKKLEMFYDRNGLVFDDNYQQDVKAKIANKIVRQNNLSFLNDSGFRIIESLESLILKLSDY